MLDSTSEVSSESAADTDPDVPVTTGVPDSADASSDRGATGGGGVDGAAGSGPREPTAGTSQPPTSDQLVEEGEIAADYLEELLDIADLDGDIDIDVENGRASVAVLSEDASGRLLRRLVGEDGDVLEALQELTRLAVQAQTGQRSRLMLDVAGHRAARRQELVLLAREAAAKVRADGQPLRLEPMSPFERKVVHDAVATAGLQSGSEGEEPRRYVVVRPA